MKTHKLLPWLIQVYIHTLNQLYATDYRERGQIQIKTQLGLFYERHN